MNGIGISGESSTEERGIEEEPMQVDQVDAPPSSSGARGKYFVFLLLSNLYTIIIHDLSLVYIFQLKKNDHFGLHMIIVYKTLFGDAT